MIGVPHPIAYQGSKRKLAQAILAHAPARVSCLYEPFCGSAALSLAALFHQRCDKVVLNDLLLPLAQLWQAICDRPRELSATYEALWQRQADNPRQTFLAVRDAFNGTRDPGSLLFLLNRCVKNAVRFNRQGQFNQAADHRRKGTHPERLRQHVLEASALLADRVTIYAGDFVQALACATPQDLVYLDPPYQGTSTGRDQRYFAPLDRQRLEQCLTDLNRRNVPVLVSFDGSCGDRHYGTDLAPELGLVKILLNAGTSSQSTLVGRREVTHEALYMSPCLVKRSAWASDHPLITSG